MGKRKRGDDKEKYSSVNIKEEGENEEEKEVYIKFLLKEKKLSQRAFEIFKIENKEIANFFFGIKSDTKKEEDKNGMNFSHPIIKTEESSESNEIEEEEDYEFNSDDQMNQYKSNSREELKNFDFNNLIEDKEIGDVNDNPLKDLLLSSDENLERKERRNCKNISNMLKSGKNEEEIKMEMFNSGNAKDFDIDKMLGIDLEINSENNNSNNYNFINTVNGFNKNINNNNNEEDNDDEDEDEDEDDLVNSGMELDFDFINKLDNENVSEDEEDAGNKITQDFISKRISDNFEKEIKKKKNKTKEDEEFGDILEKIAQQGKCPDLEDEEKEIRNRDIYIKQQDQYFVDDEEVYLNDLCTENYNWKYIKDLFKIISHAKEEPISEEDPNRDTIISYFKNICNTLLNYRPEDFLTFIYSNEYIMEALIKNSNNIEIFNLLKSVLNFRDHTSEETSFRYLKHRFGFYRKIFSKFIEDGESSFYNLGNLFLDLVKESKEIVDANYFIDKILLDTENQSKLIDLIIRERGSTSIEILSHIIKLNICQDENKKEATLNDLNKEENPSKTKCEDLKKNAITQPHTPLDEELNANNNNYNNCNKVLKTESMDIVFNPYDPMTLKKNNFTNKVLPRIIHLKNCLFGEKKICENNDDVYSKDGSKGLQSISEFSQSGVDLEINKEETKVQTFGKGTEKVFAIGFDDIEDKISDEKGEEEEVEEHKQNIINQDYEDSDNEYLNENKKKIHLK